MFMFRLSESRPVTTGGQGQQISIFKLTRITITIFKSVNGNVSALFENYIIFSNLAA